MSVSNNHPSKPFNLQVCNNATKGDREIIEMLDLVATAVILNVWGKEPRGFQIKAISTLLEINCLSGNPSSVLLIQGTGSGKSTVPQTTRVVTCGVTLIIENTLSLVANQ